MNGCESALKPEGVVVVKKIFEWMSPVSRRRADGFESPEDAQSIAKPSARPWEEMVNAGVCVLECTGVYPGTSRDSMSGRTSHMCTFPVSDQLAT